MTSVDYGPGLRYHHFRRGAWHGAIAAVALCGWAGLHVARAARFMRDVAGEG